MNKDWQEYSNRIAERINLALEKKGWQKLDLAKAVGVVPSAISRILSGEHNVTIETIVKIGNALDTDLFGADLSEFKDYLNNGYEILTTIIDRANNDLIIAARQQDFDSIENINFEIAKQEAVKSYLDALFKRFPELKD